MWTFNDDHYMKLVLSPAEAEFRSSGRLPDLFTRYYLPPDVSDEADIKAALQKVEDFWNKTKSNSKYKTFLPRLLSEKEVSGAHRQLLDPTARRDLRELVESEKIKRLEAKFEDLDRTLGVVAAKGHIAPQEKDSLIARFKSEGLTEADILKRIAPVRVAEDTTVILPSAGFPPDVCKQITSNLRALGLPNLYEFLGVAPGSSISEWSAKYRDAQRQWMQKPNDAQRTAANDLLGRIATDILRGDPKVYEDTVLWELLEQLRKEVKEAAADGQIDHAEFNALVALALNKGIEDSRAKGYIVALAKQIGASVEWSSTDDTVGCPNCFTAVSIKTHAEVCPVCGHSLWTQCPRCQTRVPQKIATCGKCNFTLSELPRVRLLVRTAELALIAGQVADAAEAAEDAARIWGRKGDVEKLLLTIEERQTRLEAIRNEIDRCLAERRLYEAGKTASSLVLDSPDHKFRDGRTPRSMAAQIDSTLKKVEFLLEKGRQCQTGHQLDDAVIAYEAALSIAQDCKTARLALERCPPESPSEVNLSLDDGAAIIDWVPGHCVGELRYVVVRQEGHAPASPGDGVRLCDTTDLSYRDDGLRPGVLVFYSIFAERWRALSPPCASHGLFTAMEVRKLTAVAGDGVVTVSWEPLGSGARVFITRKEGSQPAKQRDGTEIRPIAPDHFVDSAVTNGRTYYYRISVEYINPRGGNLMTPGQVAMASPDQPPAPVEDMRICPGAGRLELAWSPAARGAVRVYRRTNPSEWQSGAAIPAPSVSAIGLLLENIALSKAVDSAPPDGVAYYVPVTVSGDLAVVGSSRRYVSLPDVSGLIAQDFGTYLQLQWQWPNHCSFATVAWRPDAYPDDSTDPRADSRRLSKGEYDQHGGFRINNPNNTPHWVVVFAGSRIDGEDVLSTGLDLGCKAALRTTRPVEIAYHVKRGTWQRNNLALTLLSNQAVNPMPDLVVVAKHGDLQPLRVDDGVQLAVLRKSSLLGGQPATFEIKLSFTPAYIRAFFLEASAQPRFRLIDPAPSQLKMR